MRRLRWAATLALSAMAAVPLACGGGGSTGGMDDLRSAVLAHLAYEVALPTHREASVLADAMAVALSDLDTGPSLAHLDSAQAAWRTARHAWNRSEAFLLGPAEDFLLDGKVDTSPIDEPRIDELLAAATPIDAALVAGLGTTRKGFHAIEYLLFDENGNNAALFALLASGPDAARRRALLAAYGEDVASVLAQIRQSWEPGIGGFADAFARAGVNSVRYATRQAALDDLLNLLIALSELTADQRLGRPLGRTSGGIPQLPGAETSRSGNSRADVLGDLEGLRAAYEGSWDGRPGSGLASLVRVAHGPIHEVISADLLASVQTVEAIDETLLETAITTPGPVEAAYAAAKQVKTRLVADLAGVLGGTLQFSPFDGD